MNALTIAGSDPTSGAGIQGDMKTFNAMGVYGLTVITAITSQSSSRFFRSEAVSPGMIKGQIRSVISDFHVNAIKIGMVYDRKTIEAVHAELEGVRTPIVIDPIFRSTTGGTLLQPNAMNHFKRLMVPLAHVITPNVPEAERISGTRIRTLSDARKAASKIISMGAKNVVIKGGHMGGNTVTDLLLENNRFHTFSQMRLPKESHGSGCIFSASLCGSLAKGLGIVESARLAQKMSFDSIKNASAVGSGLPIAMQKDRDAVKGELASAIAEFVSIEAAYRYIPEVQTNFVFSKPKPKDLSDILGLEGRIVRTGDRVIVAGDLMYGGSHHVGRAVLEVAKKFPSARSALNLKYDIMLIRKAIERGLLVTNYNRMLEPDITKKTEGRSVSWGVKFAISKLKRAPDIIYHKGDIGKEPMILLFGKNPADVLTKFYKIA